jgi:CHAT domain-containing protein
MANERKYVDFNLVVQGLDSSTNTFKVSVPLSAVGETREEALVYYPSEDIQKKLRRLEKRDISKKDLIELGKQLTARLFPSEQIRNLFQRAIDEAGSEGSVRLRLIINHPKLAQLPWEFCYFPASEGEEDTYDNFMVLSPKYSIVRHEALDAKAPELKKEGQEQIRLLAVTANVEAYGELDLDAEKEAIQEALNDCRVEGVKLDWKPFIENPTADELIKALDQGADLFHFAGHGEFKITDVDLETQEDKGTGSLILFKDKADRSPAPFPASLLAKYLQKAGIRVAVLGACESGRRDGVSPWTGVAPSLIKEGVAAVVAMQYKVSDRLAVPFSKRFYTALASGLSIDEAVSLGRLEMYREADNGGIDWGIPVLYMRSSNGVIFPEIAKQEPKIAHDLRIEGEARIKTIKGGKFSVIEIDKVVKANQLVGKLEADSAEDFDGAVVRIKEA